MLSTGFISDTDKSGQDFKMTGTLERLGGHRCYEGGNEKDGWGGGGTATWRKGRINDTKDIRKIQREPFYVYLKLTYNIVIHTCTHVHTHAHRHI